MRRIVSSTAFKKDVKLARKRGKKIEKLDAVIELLASGKTLPRRYCDHHLTGNWNGHRECHIEPDWLLIYRYDQDFLILDRTGTHSDLL